MIDFVCQSFGLTSAFEKYDSEINPNFISLGGQPGDIGKIVISSKSGADVVFKVKNCTKEAATGRGSTIPRDRNLHSSFDYSLLFFLFSAIYLI